MRNNFFQQRANIGITRSCMRSYVRKNFLIWVETVESQIWCSRVYLLHDNFNLNLRLLKQNKTIPLEMVNCDD